MILSNINAQNTKVEVSKLVEEYLTDLGLKVHDLDFSRPWGGFFVIEENQIKKFKELFFDEVTLTEKQYEMKLSPKILVVSPAARLSWQYHHRRAELWKLIAGEAGIVRSQTDEQGDTQLMKTGKTVSLSQGERHRLVGLDTWGVVAEIWMHTDPNQPSDESDIVRVSDDYSRK
ncbi:cupin domain-containing protein [Algoriphagus hitonicola]|uniref:Mannose-6-phosphate isomerase, type 2 n=1 Tax=Algoriphagus hitonicola TaxID=435880 RepID=A0A1I2VV61_9BACT|nr:phosphoheptose isomerase [Algoriphagus hitonicola]SFG91091.1 mannose-6-phosphate isomerase, type 2 [Algoriphagus hitonicola]